jgi:hypothetical protein
MVRDVAAYAQLQPVPRSVARPIRAANRCTPERPRCAALIAALNWKAATRVVSRALHDLRSLVACLIEWLPICHLQGWFGTRSRRDRPSGVRRLRNWGHKQAADLRRLRQAAGLTRPYGEKAAEHFGEEFRHPPSHRSAADPPAEAEPPGGTTGNPRTNAS